MFDLISAGKDDNRNRPEVLTVTHATDELGPVDDRHLQVCNHNLGQVGRQLIERISAIDGFGHLVTSLFQDHPDHGPKVGIILDDKNAAQGFRLTTPDEDSIRKSPDR